MEYQSCRANGLMELAGSKAANDLMALLFVAAVAAATTWTVTPPRTRRRTPISFQRVQCNGPAEVRSSTQHDMIEDNNLLLSREKNQNGEQDNVNQLQIQHNSTSQKDLAIDSVPGVRKKERSCG